MVTDIVVDLNGVEIHLHEDPLVSVFGKQMRPPRDWSVRLPWSEISSVRVYARAMPPQGHRLVHMDIDTAYGEFVTLDENAPGFIQAVEQIAQAGAAPLPDLSLVDEEGDLLWRSPSVR
jgi:hypothetical protein